MRVDNCEIKIIHGDITELKVDAIVNAANNQLIMGGGVAGAIKRKGGKIIEQEARAVAPIETGQARVTTAGNLPAKYVIHAATMAMDFKTDETKIRKSCASCLKIAGKLKIASIAFPALGCGVGNFSYLACAKIMAQEVFRYLREKPLHLREIIFCLYTKQAHEIFNKTLFRYLEYITKKIQEGPFATVDAIIKIDNGMVLIERSNPPFGWALPGGFVDYGESLEDAVQREAKEETGLDLKDLRQFHTYSEAGRDPRFHTITTVFVARGEGKPTFGSDAASLKVVRPDELDKYHFAFDHRKVIEDYLSSLR